MIKCNIRRGSLVLECIVALSIITILMAGLYGTRVFRFDAACLYELYELRSVIRRAQMESLVTQQDQYIYIDVAENRYRYQAELYTLQSLVIIESHQTVPIKPVSFARHMIVCFATGTISAGSIYFKSTFDESIVYALRCPVGHMLKINLYRYGNVFDIIR